MILLDAADADRATVDALFADTGVLVVTGFVDPDTAGRAAAEVDDVVAADPDRRPTFADQGVGDQRETVVRNWGLGEVRDRIPTCRSILRDPRLEEWATAICGRSFKRSTGSIASTFEGCGQAWHQESRDPHPRHFTLNRIVFAAAVPPERGRLIVVPGSHTAGDIPTGGGWDDLDGQVAVAPPAGAVVLMHSRCFHMVERNRTSTPRSQFNGRVLPPECPDDITAFPLFRAGPWS